MENRGAQAGFREAFSPTGRWRAREVEDSSRQHRQLGGWQGRHQTVGEEVMRMIWTVKVQMATDISLMD